MDFKALIEFNKYTLAVAAAGFVYVLEKIGPMPTQAGRWFLLGLIGVFFTSTICGVLVFAVATAAHHSSGGSDVEARNEERIQRLGMTHAVLLLLGIAVLGGVIARDVLQPLPAGSPESVCCECSSG